MEFRSVIYIFISPCDAEEYFFWNTGIDQSRQIGFSAQEVNEVLPEVVSNGEDGYLSMEYSKITPLLVEAIKELKDENDRLKSRLEKIESIIGGMAVKQSP